MTLSYITLHFHFPKTTIQYKHYTTDYKKKEKRDKEVNQQNKQKNYTYLNENKTK